MAVLRQADERARVRAGGKFHPQGVGAVAVEAAAVCLHGVECVVDVAERAVCRTVVYRRRKGHSLPPACAQVEMLDAGFPA